MKQVRSFVKTAAGIAVAAGLVQGAWGGVPFVNIEGAGGAAFNPLAYPAGQNKPADAKETAPLSKPQFGVWYVSLGDVDVDWTSLGVAETLFERVEVSYSREVIAPTGKNIHKNNVGAKVLLVKENLGDNAWVPAVSAGAISKSTKDVAEGSDDSGQDYYVVATKLITQTPRPVLLSGGALSTDGQVTGVFGYNSDRDIAFFGNVDVLPLSNLATGFEYKQGAKFDGFKNADYWDAHAAWFASPNLTLIGAYVNAGNSTSKSKTGVGDGVVLSAQYAF